MSIQELQGARLGSVVPAAATNRLLVVYLPLFAIILQSYFKDSVMAAISQPGYWVLRIVLFLTFVALLFAFSGGAPRRHTVDDFAKERAAADPLLGLRALACLNVFFGHWFMVVFSPAHPAGDSMDFAARTALSGSPWCGVWMFFTLSGYLITKGFVTGRHSVTRDGLVRFYRNRVLRIFPVYFVAIILVAALAHGKMPSWPIIMDALLFDQETGGVIGALWSVSTEFQFYLVAPALFGLCLMLFRSVAGTAAVLAIVVPAFAVAKFTILAYHPEFWHTRVYMPLLLNLDCFLVGAAAAFLVDRARWARFYLEHGLGAGIAVAALAQIGFSSWSYPEMATYPGVPGSATRVYFLAYAPGITALVTAAVIFLFETGRRGAAKPSLIWTASTYLGTLTYCLYVMHEPVILALRAAFAGEMTLVRALAIFPAGFALSAAAAWLLYYFVERLADRQRGG